MQSGENALLQVPRELVHDWRIPAVCQFGRSCI